MKQLATEQKRMGLETLPLNLLGPFAHELHASDLCSREVHDNAVPAEPELRFRDVDAREDDVVDVVR